VKTKKHPSQDLKASIVKSVQSGISISHLSGIHKFHRVTIHRWLREDSAGSDFARRADPGSGRQAKLDGSNAGRLIKIIDKPASKFGFETDLWDTKRVRIICRKRLGLKLSHMAVWRFLQRIDYSCKKVQKRYYEADQSKKEEWLNKTVGKIKATVRKYRAILYFEDESNVSLTPVMGRTWAPKGKKVYSYVTGNRGSLSAISAISSDGRLIFRTFHGSKRFNSQDIIDFFAEMLSHHRRRHIVVVLDQASCHKSKKVKAYIESQKRLHVYWLPPKSPEFNPDEQVWNHLKHTELKNHMETNTKGLKKLVNRKMRGLSKSQTKLMGIFKRCDFAHIYLP
jgi:transposase